MMIYHLFSIFVTKQRHQTEFCRLSTNNSLQSSLALGCEIRKTENIKEIVQDDDSLKGEDNMAAVIDESPEKNEDNGESQELIDEKQEEARESEDNFEEDVFLLNRTISKHSFLSPNSDSSASAEMRRKMVQNLKPNSLIFTEEETTYKPPRRKTTANKPGRS